MINILELIDGGFIGGGQIHVISIVKNLNKSKFHAIVSASSDGEFKNLLDKYGLEFQPVHLPKFYRKKYLKPLIDLVERNKIEIIHSHGGVAGVYSRMLKKNIHGIRIVHSIHGIHYINSGNPFRRFISKAIEQYLVPYTDKFIVASEGDFKTAERIKIANPEITEIIPNGIDLSRFFESSSDKTLRVRFAGDENGFIAGNISRFDFQKNQRLIINSSSEILRKYPDVHFVFIGNGKYLKQCKSLVRALNVEKNFLFLDETKETEKFYKNFDLFVFPSLWEGLSLTVIEAMASGSAILISDIPQNKELISGGYSGLTFKSGDKNDFTEKFFRLYEDKILRTQLGENALNESKRYSEKSMVEKIQNVYLCL